MIINDMLVINDRIQLLDQLIEVSIGKIREMQLAGSTNEYKKCLIVSMLQNCIEEKRNILKEITHDRESDTFSGILKSAIQKSGLYRLIRIGVRKGSDNVIQVKTKIGKREKRMMHMQLLQQQHMLQ